MARPKRLALALAALQAGDAIACAIPLPILKADLDRLGCSDSLQRAIPKIKAASVVGLLLGLKWPRLGALTCGALVAYFVAALGFHVRAGDRGLRSAPAAAMGGWSIATWLLVYRGTPTT